MKAKGPRKITRLTASLTALILVGLIFQSSAALPTSAELRLRRQWVAKHFDAKAGALPFEVSFEDTLEQQTVPGATLSALPVEIPSAPGSTIVYYHASH
jgi:hypothetical protein